MRGTRSSTYGRCHSTWSVGIISLLSKNPRLGRLVDLPPLSQGSPASVRQAQESSLRVKGAKLFNIIPRELRGLDCVTVDTFKARLDAWLATIPDQPSIPGRQRAAASNSLLDQVISVKNT